MTTEFTGPVLISDMAGTTVADDGLVTAAFADAARAGGLLPGTDDFDRALDYVNATMGQSKIVVFTHIFGSRERAVVANSAFERSYHEFVDDGLCAR